MKSVIKMAVAAPFVMLAGIQTAAASDFLCTWFPSLCHAPGNPGGGSASVPEPATLALLATGAVVYGAKFLRRSRSK